MFIFFRDLCEYVAFVLPKGVRRDCVEFIFLYIFMYIHMCIYMRAYVMYADMYVIVCTYV